MTDHTAEPIRRINPPELGSPPSYSQIVEDRPAVFISLPARPRSTPPPKKTTPPTPLPPPPA